MGRSSLGKAAAAYSNGMLNFHFKKRGSQEKQNAHKISVSVFGFCIQTGA